MLEAKNDDLWGSQRNVKRHRFSMVAEETGSISSVFQNPAEIPVFQGDKSNRGFQDDGASLSGGSSSGPADSITKSNRKSGRGRFRQCQADLWTMRFEELLQFKADIGTCLVPHKYPPLPQLAQWCKRQRYQRHLKVNGKESTMSDEREQLLDSVGFVWDSHQAAWEDKIRDLKLFKAQYGHCRVPPKYEDRSLATWVKQQRRQCKLHRQGLKSTLSPSRIADLQSLGFEWNPRGLKLSNSSDSFPVGGRRHF